MEKLFVPPQPSLDMKGLGFDESCFGYYVGLGDSKEDPFKLVQIQSEKGQFEWADNVYHAPTYSQAFKYFREKYRLDGKPEYLLNDWYCYIIDDMKEEDTSRRLFTEFPSHEEAELECLRKLIEIVKEKQHDESPHTKTFRTPSSDYNSRGGYRK